MFLLIAMVLTRIAMLRRHGVSAMRFGQTNKSDFLLPPFVLFYFYTILAHAFGWPTPSGSAFFSHAVAGWAGVFACTAGLILMAWSLLSFGRSFRVGIDAERPGKLITTGIFAVTRNPIYVAFGLVLLGQLLLFPNWITLIFLICGAAVIHRQVLREEQFLRRHYGHAYADYAGCVRRYL
jgi:protein-S-isoprenylcysteine O-methyltransferase Ste14